MGSVQPIVVEEFFWNITVGYVVTAADIRRARKRLGWTQVELAQQAHVSQPYVSRVERGDAPPPEAILLALGLTDQPARRPQQTTPLQLWMPHPEPSGDAILVRRWKRPDASGDALTCTQLPRGGFILLALDIAGHGLEQVPKATYLQGWLRGWVRALSVVPRLESFVEDLGQELDHSGLRAAWLAVILSPLQHAAHSLAYQAAASRFPAPLLVIGAPPATFPSIAHNGEVQRHNLRPPWRLVLASDGLLNRLGSGDEVRGKRRLADWQLGADRDLDPAAFLQTKLPVVDDESYGDVSWKRWDGTSAFAIDSLPELHRVKRVLQQTLPLPSDRSQSLLVAASEALANVRRHAYQGVDGLVEVAWRDEGDCVRVEVRDSGVGGPLIERGGFGVMRGHADSVDVRGAFPQGTVVSLVKNKQGESG